MQANIWRMFNGVFEFTRRLSLWFMQITSNFAGSDQRYVNQENMIQFQNVSFRR